MTVVTREQVIEWSAKREWRRDQLPMSDEDADRTWAAIDESVRTKYRIEAARLPGDRRGA